jgi:carbonic anhydrase
VMCIDPRLDARIVMGDTRDQYDVVRIPGSVLSEEAIEAIELGVKEHRVKVVFFTTHTECAMEAVAHSHEAEHFPALSRAVLNREERFRALLARPLIAERIASGELIVKRFLIDTADDRLIPVD